MIMSSLAKEKAQARKSAFSARAKAHALGGDDIANDYLVGLLTRFSPGNVIAGYMPIHSEISPLAAMTAFHESGHPICVPVIQGPGKPLLFQQWDPGCGMSKGAFGALVPLSGDFLKPDVLIIPLVAFDQAGSRLGYGGGYYDRSLAMLRAEKPVTAIGLAYSGQEIKAIPREKTDEKLDFLTSETGVVQLSEI